MRKMEIKEIEKILKEKGCNIIKTKENNTLILIKVAFSGCMIKFVMPNEINKYLWNFTIFDDSVHLHFDKELMKGGLKNGI